MNLELVCYQNDFQARKNQSCEVVLTPKNKMSMLNGGKQEGYLKMEIY